MKQSEFKEIDKIWKLLEVALAEVESTNFDSNYELDMGIWHREKKGSNKCIVCLAGSVIRNWIDFESSAVPCDFDDKTHIRLYAIDDIRKVYLYEAIVRLYPNGFWKTPDVEQKIVDLSYEAKRLCLRFFILKVLLLEILETMTKVYHFINGLKLN